jgi:hypothetical protein
MSFTGSEHHILKTTSLNGLRVHLVTGATDIAVLYAAYRLCELHGVRYYLHGDVVPSDAWRGLQHLDASDTPVFATRGLHPFHDFAEGPDW